MVEQGERRRVMAQSGPGLFPLARHAEEDILRWMNAPVAPSEDLWRVVAKGEEYEPLRRQALEAVVLGRGLAELLSRMEALEGAISAAMGQVIALGKRLEALEERLAEQGVVRNAMLCDLAREGYSLRWPITVVVEEYEEETVARLPEVQAFASAATEGEALALLKEDIVQLYDDLTSTPEEQLGKLPRQWRAVLAHLIEKDGAA